MSDEQSSQSHLVSLCTQRSILRRICRFCNDISTSDTNKNPYEIAILSNNAKLMVDCGVRYENGINVKKNDKKAFELFQRAADMGNADAMVNLGDCYKDGKGVPQDKKKAFELYQRASDMGNTDAMVSLGFCYQNGTGVLRNTKTAFELYKQAADLGNASAMLRLALCYKDGKGVVKDMKKAIELFQRAADMGNASAMLRLALCYKDGKGVEQDKEKAIEFYQKAADMGNASAMFNLARCYKYGTSIPKDLNKAFELFQRAADMGNTNAMVSLGVCYENGNGVPKDMKKAIELYQRASDLGNACAMFNLGVRYENGNGVPKDMKKAIELYERAVELGNSDAMYNLAICYMNGDGVEKDKKKAFELFERAVEKGNTDAMFSLALLCYKYGTSIPKDMKKVIKLYELAVEKGNSDAMFSLAICYKNGKGVAKDEKKAIEFFQKSFDISETINYDEKHLDHVIKTALIISDYYDFYIKDLNQLKKYAKSVKSFITTHKNEFGENFYTDYQIELKKDGADTGLIITKIDDTTKSNGKKYFLKIYPYSEKIYREKLTEVEKFRLLDPENSMNVFDLYVDKANGCIIFCSEQALTGEIKLFPKFKFEQIKEVLEQLKTSLDKNQEFKNLCQFFKIITYSVLLNLGDIRYSNVLMATKQQDDDKDIRVKLIDFQAYLIGCDNKIDYNFEETKKFFENFLDLFLYINASIYKLKPTSEKHLQKKLDKIKNFIKENLEISQILEEKVLKYIEEVFTKVENLSQKTEKLSSQKPTDQVSEPTTAVSSTTQSLPAQPSCDDTIKLSGTPEQSEEDLGTLLEVKVQILKQFCERYQYIQEQLEKYLKSKTAETPKDAKPTSESEQKFTNPSPAKPTSGAAVAAAASATLATVAVGYANIIASLAARQVRLEEMRKRIATIQERIDGESQTSTSKNQKLII